MRKILLVVDTAKLDMLYVCMDGTYASQMCVQVPFLSPKHDILGLPVSSDTTALPKSYFNLRASNCEIIPAKCLFFNFQKFAATGHYGIKNPLPDVISKLHRFFWLLKFRLLVVKSHWLSRATHSQNA